MKYRSVAESVFSIRFTFIQWQTRKRKYLIIDQIERRLHRSRETYFK